jgi:hypothetical protein
MRMVRGRAVRRTKAAERRGIVSEKNQIQNCLAIRDELLLQDPLSLLKIQNWSELTPSLVSALGSGAVRFLVRLRLNVMPPLAFMSRRRRPPRFLH